MKKFVKIAVVFVTLATFMASCSNDIGLTDSGVNSSGESGGSSGENGGGVNTPIPFENLGEYTELHAGTNGSAGTSASYVNFGTWPQTLMAKDVTVNETTAEKKEVGKFTYYKGSDDNWYCKVKEQACKNDEQYKYANGDRVATASANSYKWFKVEPIKWRVLTTTSSGNKIIFCENGIYAGISYYYPYNLNADRTISGKTIYNNNYMHSEIRAWLNGYSYDVGETNPENIHKDKGFLQTAFTSAEYSKIVDKLVENGFASTGQANNDYICADTNDRIFLLSYSEINDIGFDYGFTNNNTRIRKPTDFALANGASLDSTIGVGGQFFLRSPHQSQKATVYYVMNNGAVSSAYVRELSVVVVPALCVTP